MKRVIWTLIIASLAIFSTGTVFATNIHVKADGTGDYPTIQAAITAAENGDVIILEPGTFTGFGNRDINFQGKAIIVRSTDPYNQSISESTIIDCQDSGGGFILNSGEESDCVIAGLTITNGVAQYGGGIYCNGSSPVITHCRFIDNFSTGGYGGGIYSDGGNIIVMDCYFAGNDANSVYGNAGGIKNLLGEIKVTNCIFSGNYQTGITNSQAFSVNITNCIFINNNTSNAIRNLSSAKININNCTVSGNNGNGIVTLSSISNIKNCIFWNNAGAELENNERWYAVSYSCIQGGYSGIGNISLNPNFTSGPDGDFYLSQIAAGQTSDSPCVDAGSDTATNLYMDSKTTRTDQVGDSGIVDMGYHYGQSDNPILHILPLSLEFYTDTNDANLGTKTFTIMNLGKESLNWNATVDAEWLSIDVNSGLCPAFGDSNTVTVDVNMANLNPGSTYHANIVVSDPTASDSPKIVTVTSSIVSDLTKMYWTDSSAGKIQRANPDGSDVEDLVTTGLTAPHGIAVDFFNNKMYWTDVGTGKIQRANIDGTGIEDLVTGLDYPYGIALDPFSSKMYWTDEDAGKIQRANLDGNDIEDVITTSKPSAIALDLSYDTKIYWSYISAIYRSNLNGTDIEHLVTTSMAPVSAIDLDLDAGKMYFLAPPDILRSNIDGSDLETLASWLGTLMGISFDPASSKVYWTNQNNGKIQRVNLDGSNIEDIVTGLSGPTGLASRRINGFSVSPRYLEFEAGLDGPNPPSQTIGIRNFGEGPLNWTANTDADWLSIDVKSGSCPGPGDSNVITVDVDVTGLVAGTYDANIVLFDGNSPKPVAVELEVISPSIELSDDEFYFSAVEDGYSPANQILGIQNVGRGALNWQVSETCDWLSLEPNCGSSTGEVDDVNIVVDVSGLMGTIHTCELTVTDPCADNSPQIVNVTLNYRTSDKVYWTDTGTGKIQRANPDGSVIEDIVTGLSEPDGIAIDSVSGTVYWTNRDAGKIQRANLDGSNVEDIISGLSSPCGIALDIVSGKMYWTDTVTDNIQRANLDGTNVEELVTGVGPPQGIALDLPGGKMYWANPNPNSHKIQRANLDGSNVEDLITTGLYHPYDIGLDTPNRRMYWCEEDKICRAGIEGTHDFIATAMTNFPSAASPRSVSVWIKWDRPTGYKQVICGYGDNAPGFTVFGAFLDESNPANLYCWNNYWDGATYNYDTGIDIAIGQWTHIVLTYDGTNIRAYKNEVLTDTTPRTLNTVLEKSLIGGNDWHKSDYLKGALDNMMMFDKQLSQEEIELLYNYGDGTEEIPDGNGIDLLPYCVGHWKMNDNAADTVVLDSSPRHNYGTAKNNTSNLHDDSGNPPYLSGALTFGRIEELVQFAPESHLNYIDMDLISDKIYWTDSGTDKIQRANLDGSNIEDVVTGLDTPLGLALAIPYCDYALAGDLNNDCTVDFYDFVIAASNWRIDCIADPCDPACVPK